MGIGLVLLACTELGQRPNRTPASADASVAELADGAAEAPDAAPACFEGETQPCTCGDETASEEPDEMSDAALPDDGGRPADAAARDAGDGAAGDDAGIRTRPRRSNRGTRTCVDSAWGACTTTCDQRGLYGTCAVGVVTCDDVTSTWGACSIAPTERDACDHVNDDDCDGTPNDGCACLSGTMQTCNACGGTRTCVDGAWGECPGGSAPAKTWYTDADGDGFGAPMGATKATCNGQPPEATGWAASSTDCCDRDPDVHPGQGRFFYTPSACKDYNYDCNGTTEFGVGASPTAVVTTINTQRVTSGGCSTLTCGGTSLAGTLACGTTLNEVRCSSANRTCNRTVVGVRYVFCR